MSSEKVIPGEIELEMLKELLKSEDVWEFERVKVGRSYKNGKIIGPNVSAIQDTLFRLWEHRYLDEIYFPRWYRMNHLLWVIKSGHPDYADPEFVETHFDTFPDDDGNEDALLLVICDACIDTMQYILSYSYPGPDKETYPYNHWWFNLHPEWQDYAYGVTEEFIESLGIRPEASYQMELF